MNKQDMMRFEVLIKKSGLTSADAYKMGGNFFKSTYFFFYPHTLPISQRTYLPERDTLPPAHIPYKQLHQHASQHHKVKEKVFFHS
ncbi:hypothetical protein [Maridesulfovibrio sp.]|uniref:hypothetical protein n=1 Tax=Maridesulfovibrio sp. TaxID=2795000 RepID=UPI0039EE6AEA